MPPASSQMVQNWEELLIHHRVVFYSEGSGQSEELSLEESHKVQQGEIQNLASGEE